MNNHNLFYEIIQICWHVAVPRKWPFNYVLMWRVPNRFFRIWDWAYLKAGFQLVFRYILLGFLEWEESWMRNCYHEQDMGIGDLRGRIQEIITETNQEGQIPWKSKKA